MPPMATGCPEQIARPLAAQPVAGSRHLLTMRAPLVLMIACVALTASAASIFALMSKRFKDLKIEQMK